MVLGVLLLFVGLAGSAYAFNAAPQGEKASAEESTPLQKSPSKAASKASVAPGGGGEAKGKGADGAESDESTDDSEEDD